MEENLDEKTTEEDDHTGGKNSRKGTDDTNNEDLDEPTETRVEEKTRGRLKKNSLFECGFVPIPRVPKLTIKKKVQVVMVEKKYSQI